MAEGDKTIDLNGKCTAMDVPNRTFRIKDVDGAEHPFKWTEPLDVVMVKNSEARWKPGYYLTVTFNPDTHVVKNVAYWQEGKEKFPKEARGGGGRPRNERAIMLQCLFKGAVELYLHSVPPGEKFNVAAALKDCRLAAAQEVAEFCKDGGVS